MLKLFLTFVKIGTFTFGGGYAMVPLIEDELVHKQLILSEEEFVDYLSIAQSFPGVLAVNLSVLIGYRLYKVPGVLICTLGSILSSFVILLILSYFYFNDNSLTFLDGFFKGVSPVVIALLFYSFTNLFKKIDKSKLNILLLSTSFILVAIFNLSPIYLIIGGGIYSLWLK